VKLAVLFEPSGEHNNKLRFVFLGVGCFLFFYLEKMKKLLKGWKEKIK